MRSESTVWRREGGAGICSFHSKDMKPQLQVEPPLELRYFQSREELKSVLQVSHLGGILSNVELYILAWYHNPHPVGYEYHYSHPPQALSTVSGHVIIFIICSLDMSKKSSEMMRFSWGTVLALCVRVHK